MEKSFEKQLELMIGAGAAGALCLGSMGKMESIRNSEYPGIARTCVRAAAGRIPVLVGVMDCSVDRVLDRIDALGDMKIDGVVATMPFYYKTDSQSIVRFFELLSKASRYPVYMYDLPSVTQSPITFQIMEQVEKMPNIRGIKTANLTLIAELQRNGVFGDDFSFYCSNLDLFDVAIRAGIGKNLDGMFTCTPYNSKRMYESDDPAEISKYLNRILKLRNLFVRENVLAAYSYAMEVLGCPGDYHPDYAPPVSGELKEEIRGMMKEIGEI